MATSCGFESHLRHHLVDSGLPVRFRLRPLDFVATLARTSSRRNQRVALGRHLPSAERPEPPPDGSRRVRLPPPAPLRIKHLRRNPPDSLRGCFAPCHTPVTLKVRKSQHLTTVANATRGAHYEYAHEPRWGCTVSPLVHLNSTDSHHQSPSAPPTAITCPKGITNNA